MRVRIDSQEAMEAFAAVNGPRGLLAGDLLAALPPLLNPD